MGFELYEVKVTADAEEDLSRAVQYLVFEKKNDQAADALIIDFYETADALRNVAGRLTLCENPLLASRGYRFIHFRRHDYNPFYRMVGNVAVVDMMLHDLQDRDKAMR